VRTYLQHITLLLVTASTGCGTIRDLGKSEPYSSLIGRGTTTCTMALWKSSRTNYRILENRLASREHDVFYRAEKAALLYEVPPGTALTVERVCHDDRWTMAEHPVLAIGVLHIDGKNIPFEYEIGFVLGGKGELAPLPWAQRRGKGGAPTH